jgi:hypothetical protein
LSSAFAAPDYAPVNKTLNDLLAVIGNLKTEIPKIHDAASAAKAVDSFATATNAFTEALADYARKNPELANSAEPPPEIADVMKKFEKSKEIYPTLGADLGHAVSPFADDPAVAIAIGKFQVAMDRMDKLGGAH